MARIVVAGYLLRHPVPGNMYAFLHYVIGLRRLGHDVVYLEESGWPDSCYDPLTSAYSSDPAVGLSLAGGLLQKSGSEDVPLVYVDRESRRTWGDGGAGIHALLAGCDLLLNVGGVCWLPEFGDARRLALVDMDPLFTQAGVFAAEGRDMYDAYFTYGTAVGSPDCLIPNDGLRWQATLPPVVPELWDLGQPPPAGAFSTIANWSAYGTTVVRGVEYGQKDVEFARLVDVPRRAGVPVKLAAAGMSAAEANAFTAGGWEVVSPSIGAAVDTYRDFVGSSAGEFSAAKHGYVTTRTGWVSDRTVCYLASGRPAIVQDTGAAVPTGAGFVTFSTADEAVDRLGEVAGQLAHHSREALALAQDVFHYDVVLPSLLARCER